MVLSQRESIGITSSTTVNEESAAQVSFGVRGGSSVGCLASSGSNTVAQRVHTFETCGPSQVATTITSVDTSSATGYLVKYKATVGETFFMSVQMNGFDIKGTVFAGVAVLPGSADPTKFIVSPAVTPSPANKEDTTLVTLRDSFNNIMGTPSVAVNATAVLGTNSPVVASQYTGGGQYSAQFLPFKAGTYTIVLGAGGASFKTLFHVVQAA